MAGAPEWLNAKEVAFMIRVTENWLYQRRRLKKPPISHKIGGLVRYRRKDIEAWIESTQNG